SKLQKEPELLKRAFYTTTQLTSLISFPIFTGMAVLAPEIVRSLFGAKWIPSVPVMQVLAFIGILHSLQYFNGSIIMAMGKPAWKLKLNCLHATANVIAFAIVVRWGILAVASAYVIRGYLLSPIELFIIRKLIPIRISIYLRQYVVPLIATITMAVAILGFKYLFGSYLIAPALLVIATILGMATYTVMIVILAPKLADKIFSSVQLAIPKKLGKITNK
ncbi:MAG: polysaccharide biosynthesis C-terminal domain-containing protein, partial [Cyanobacteria bacterium J06628_3]